MNISCKYLEILIIENYYEKVFCYDVYAKRI